VRLAQGDRGPMTDSEKEQLLVRGIAVAGSGSQWTLLGTTEKDAAEKVKTARDASARLNLWTSTCIDGSHPVTVVTARKIEEPIGPAKTARQVNGVSKALSPAYCEMFGALSADFISVGSALAASGPLRK